MWHNLKVLVSPLLPANPLNHRPQNLIREVFFLFSWIFSSAGGVLFPSFSLRSSKINAGGGSTPTRAGFFSCGEIAYAQHHTSRSERLAKSHRHFECVSPLPLPRRLYYLYQLYCFPSCPFVFAESHGCRMQSVVFTSAWRIWDWSAVSGAEASASSVASPCRKAWSPTL